MTHQVQDKENSNNIPSTFTDGRKTSPLALVAFTQK